MRLQKLSLLVLLTCTLTGCSWFQKATTKPGQPYPTNLKGMAILHINDVYEIGPLEGGKVGGMARVATEFKALQKEFFHAHLMLAGDFLSPSVMGTVKLEGERVNGAQMIDIMNQVGVTHACFGNHEFDLKEADLQKRIDESQFTWIAGNVMQNTPAGKQSFQRKEKNLPYCQVLYVSDEKKAWKVGILSVCLDANQKDFVHYEDVYQSARDQYKLLKETYEVDFVIALTHLSIEEDRKLAEEIPDLKLIMGGHEHENHYETVGEVPIAKADANAKSAWIHRFDYDAATDQLSVKSELVLMNEGVTEDTAIVREVSRWEEDIFTAFQAQGIDPKAEVCALETPLDGLERNIRTQQTNLGQAIAQAMHACYPTANAAIFNGGSVRIDDKLEGDITEYDILRALPFGGSVWQVKMEGSLLRKVLEMGEVNKGSGGYLQYDRIQKVGDEWQIGGTTLVPEESYDVAISDFLTSENTQVGEIRKPEEGDKARDIRIAFATYLRENCE